LENVLLTVSPIGVVEVVYEMATSVPGRVVIESLNTFKLLCSTVFAILEQPDNEGGLGEDTKKARNEQLGQRIGERNFMGDVPSFVVSVAGCPLMASLCEAGEKPRFRGK
jgi:hypothetical protein